MILITSAKYINPELQVEFGKIPPSFLPLGAKRLYEHQVKLLQDSGEKIVFSLPSSYALNSADVKKLESLNVEIIFVKDGLSLGESIVYVLNMLLPIDNELSILHGDTLFTHLESRHDRDSLSISKVDTSYNWEYVVNDGEILIGESTDDVAVLSEYVVSGYFHFTDAYGFIKCLTQSDYNFIQAIKEYEKSHVIELRKNDTWLDFGLLSTYYHSRKSFTTERSFNSLCIKHGYVVKCSEKQGKLDSEINWFKNFPHELDLFVPRFEQAEDNCYKTEYMFLSTLSELYVFGELPSYVWRQIFTTAKDFLIKLHTYSADKNNINFDYKTKTIERLEEFSRAKNLDLNRSWKYNGVNIPSINMIVEDLDKYLVKQNEVYHFIHGDFCMSNIMYDFRANTIKVYDPRGMDFDNNISVYGKKEYDYTKIMHSAIGLYDFIISGFYELKVSSYEIEFTLYAPQNIDDIQNVYFDVFDDADKNELYAVMIHLFLSMLPLHSDDEQRQYALLANAFRLYENLKEEK